MRRKEIRMTDGPLRKNILLYSVPLMFSNVLQILFNLADIAVVGKFAGAIALGAVGSTTILIMLTTGLMQGLASGVNAVTALFTGAGQKEKVKQTVHSSVLLCLLLGFLILLAGLFLTRPVLILMKTKDELIDGAVLYLTIYLLGSPALAMFNFGSAVLNAVGDTRRPLRILTAAGVINVILNFVFVLGFKLNVAGVAIASIISQYFSAVLVIRLLVTAETDYALHPKKIRLTRDVTIKVLRIGIPSAVQYSLFAIANLFVQSAVNYFDHVVVEGHSAAANADNLVYDMMAAFYTACTSFIAQNYGAGNKKRILHTYLITTLYAFGLAAVYGLLLYIFRRPFLLLFTSDEEVISYGMIRIGIMSVSYCISAFMDNSIAAARGIGKTTVPTVIVILGTVVYRIVWIYTVFAYFHTLQSLYLLFGTAWIFTAICGNIYFFRNYRKIGLPVHETEN